MLKILLVDDEFTERDGMKFLISKFKLPFEVAEAENGKRALEYVRHDKVDILLTDVRMPYMDGLELAEETFRCSPDTVIIIYSAYSEFEYARKACGVNAVNYLLKPIEVEEFEQVMKQAIALCKERERQYAEREGLLQSEKKYLLYQMFHSNTFKPEYVKRLKAYQVNLEHRYMALISIETSLDYFEQHKEAFLAYLKASLRHEAEQAILSANQAYILLYGYEPIDEDASLRAVKKLYAYIAQADGMQVSVFIGKAFYGIHNFKARIAALEELRARLFHYTFGIRRETELDMEGKGLSKEQFSHKEAILEAVKAKDLKRVNEGICSFIRLLEQGKSVNADYSKYVLVDIIKVLFAEYGAYNQEFQLHATDRIMKSNSTEDIENILSTYLDEITRQEDEKQDGLSAPVAEIKRIVCNEYMEDISLEDIARKVCLAPGYVSYIFKQETGRNLIKYVTDYRMGKAKEMLEKGNRKITDIARDCGYQNQSYFIKLFKSYYGVTPKQYREQGKKR